MGKMQREKGKRFERAIAAELRKRWPNAIVRRASQAERADNPDVFIEGGPPILARLWLELQDARNPTPKAKLQQACLDVNAYYCARGIGPALNGDTRLRLPVVVWHRLGERTSYATMSAWVLDALRCREVHSEPGLLVTIALDDLLDTIEIYNPNSCTCTYEVGSGGPVCSCWYGKQRTA